MGFDVNRFTNLGEFEEELICPICHEILQEPMVTSCEHTFCRECISKWFQERRTCPVDGNSIPYRDDLKSSPLMVRNILGKLKIHCDFQVEGCEEIVRLDALNAHASKCPFKPVVPENTKIWPKISNSISGFFSTVYNGFRNVAVLRPERRERRRRSASFMPPNNYGLTRRGPIRRQNLVFEDEDLHDINVRRNADETNIIKIWFIILAVTIITFLLRAIVMNLVSFYGENTFSCSVGVGIIIFCWYIRDNPGNNFNFILD